MDFNCNFARVENNVYTLNVDEIQYSKEVLNIEDLKQAINASIKMLKNRSYIIQVNILTDALSNM